ncbi:PAS domain-containing protein [Virgibacillus oceani]
MNIKDFYLVNALMDEMNDMIFVVKVENKTDFIYDYLNCAALNGAGMTENIIGKSVRETFPNERGEFLYNQYKEVVTSRETLVFESVYFSPLRKKHYFETKLIPFFNDKKECTQVVEIVKDMTKEKWLYEDVKCTWDRYNESKSRYLSLFHHNPDPFFSIDSDGCIANVNVEAENITGYHFKDLIGNAFHSLIAEEDRYTFKELFRNALSGNIQSSNLVIFDKTGDRIKVALKVIPVFFDEEIIAMDGILKVITNDKERIESM